MTEGIANTKQGSRITGSGYAQQMSRARAGSVYLASLCTVWFRMLATVASSQTQPTDDRDSIMTIDGESTWRAQIVS